MRTVDTTVVDYAFIEKGAGDGALSDIPIQILPGATNTAVTRRA